MVVSAYNANKRTQSLRSASTNNESVSSEGKICEKSEKKNAIDLRTTHS